MATAFETYIQQELPKRPVMLTTANASYDGDPNGGGAPAVVSGAPAGTFYLRLTGNVLYKKNSSTAGTWEVVGSGGGPAAFAKVFVVAVPALADLVAVHAAFAGNDASNTFPGPITNPDVPRNLQVALASGWDGGDVTAVGTDQFDAAVTETFTTGSGVTRVGVKVFKTVTSLTKATVGASAAAATVGIGNKLGITGVLVDTTSAVLLCDNTGEPATLDATYDAFTPTTLPNGAFSYALIANVSA